MRVRGQVRAEAGEEIIIARGKEPVVRLEPLARKKRSRGFGALKGKLVVPDSFFDPLPEEELRAWGIILAAPESS